MTNKILVRFKQQVACLELIPSSGGCFELTVDGELIYSKLKTKVFPDEGEMLTQVGNRVQPVGDKR